MRKSLTPVFKAANLMARADDVGHRVIVCGGRDYSDADRMAAVMDRYRTRFGISVLIEGGATGADSLAREWAHKSGILVATFPADWEAHGPAAGPIRNAFMLESGEPDAVVAFPGGRGTADMVAKAEAAGVKVWKLER